MVSWKGARVLVTGAAGFVGANLVRFLLQKEARVSIILRRETATWRLDEILQSLDVRTVDLLDRQAVRASLQEMQPEFVFHLAIGRSNAYDLVSSNVMGTFHLLEALQDVGSLRRMVHAGSSLEYGRKNVPLEESQIVEPDTIHGATKAAGTLLVQQKASTGFPAVVLRIFSVYGYWEGPSRLIPTAILSCMEGREILLTEPGFRRDFVFVSDVVEALVAGAESTGHISTVLNVASGTQTTNEEIVDRIQSILGTSVPVRFGAFSPHVSDTSHWVGNPQRTAEVLNWKTQIDVPEGLKRTVSWMRSNIHHYRKPDRRLE